MIKLVASDLDGTIIDKAGSIYENNFKAINDLNKKNIDFVICTGKTYPIVKGMCSKFNANYGIFGNGNEIINLKTGEEIYKQLLTPEQINSCISIAKEHKLHVHLYTNTEIITESLQYMDLRNYKLQQSKIYDSSLKITIIPDISQYLLFNNPQVCKLVISSEKDLSNVKDEILEKEDISVTTIRKYGEYKDSIINKEYEYLDVSPKNINKNTALNILKNYLKINNDEVLAIGDNLNDLDTFFQIISLEMNVRLFKRESLIIFDEIQRFPQARQAIKYLVEDGRYDYLETGSLISIKENVENITLPSEERKIRMYPVDFEEFMIYMGEELLFEYIKNCWDKKKPLDEKMHSKVMYLFKEYLLVGGMPQALKAYKNGNKDFYAADVEKRDILELYRDDIKKAAKRYNSRVSALFENIPGYLSTHEKRVVLSELGESNRSFDRYDEPLFWLDDSMICNLCYRCTDPNVGFALNKDDSYVKCYMGDTGLLVSLAFSENELSSSRLYQQIMNDKLSLNKGMLYENMIAQMITSMGKKLYFYTKYNKEKHRNDIEIDFLLSNESKTNLKVFPIEVKSSKNYSATSLDKFKDLFGKKIATPYIVHPKNFARKDNIICIPPYMVCAALSDDLE